MIKKKRYKKRRAYDQAGPGYYVAVIPVIVVILFPFLWLFLTSITPQSELANVGVASITNASFSAYEGIFTERNFGSSVLNSTVVAGVTTVISACLCACSAYALARLKFKHKKLILLLVLSASMFPQIVVLAPIYMMVTSLGLKNTWIALIIPYLTFTMPLSIWYMTTFFRSIPFELEEAAKIDGCTPLQSFAKVIVPLAAPGVFTTCILIFIQAWNEYLISSTINTSEEARTVPVAITLFRGEFSTPWVEISAAIIAVTLPIAILVLVLQRRIIAGLTSGSVKG